MIWFCSVVVIMCASHTQGPRSELERTGSDSLPDPVIAKCFDTPQENFGEFAGYKFLYN